MLFAMLLAGCPSSGLSTTGDPVVTANQQSLDIHKGDCNGPVVIQVPNGTNLVDIGPANSAFCEQAAYH